MEVTLDEVRKVFLGVIEGSISRESADEWAYSLMQKSDSDDLLFSPAAEKEKIWGGIMYLYGVDNKVSPNEYLHSIEDIRTVLDDRL